MYCVTLKSEIGQRFARALSAEEKDAKFHLICAFDIVSVLKRFQKMTGIPMNARILQFHFEYASSIQSYFGGNDANQFDSLFLARDLIIREDDFSDLTPTISFMHIVNFAHAAKVSIQFKKYKNIGMLFFLSTLHCF
jgi:hypothetical protein